MIRCDAIIVDDMVDTAGTLCKAAEILKVTTPTSTPNPQSTTPNYLPYYNPNISNQSS